MRKLHNDGRMIDIEPHRPALLEFLRGVDGLVAAYLYGSYGTPEQTPLSDVDLALIFRPDAVPEFKEELGLIGQITEILQEEDVSVTLLNRSPVIFQMRVIDTGRLLLCLDPDGLADFHEYVFSRHGDFIVFHESFLKEYDETLVAMYGAKTS